MINCNDIQATADILLAKFASCSVLEAADLDLLVELVVAVNSCTEGNLTQDNLFRVIDLGSLVETQDVADVINGLSNFTVTETQLVIFTVTEDPYTGARVDDKLRYVTILKGKDSYGLGGTQLVNSDLLLLNPVQLRTIANTTILNSLVGDTTILSGWVTYDGTGLDFTSTPIVFRFSGDTYTAPSVTLSLATGDATNPRYDSFVVDSTDSTLKVIQGTPSGSPLVPQPDFISQILVTSILVPPLATVPGVITEELVYDEFVGEPNEWTVTDDGGGTIVLNDATDPYVGSVHIEATSVDTETITFTNDVPIDRSDFSNLTFKLKNVSSNFPWKMLLIFYNGTDIVSFPFEIADGNNGFEYDSVGTWHTIIIPKSQLQLSDDFDSFELTFKSTNADVRLDEFRLIFGLDNPDNGVSYLNLTDTIDNTYDGKDGYFPKVTGNELILSPISVDNINSDADGNVALQSPKYTGSVIDLSIPYTTFYNTSDADTKNYTSYTVTNAVIGGEAWIRINAGSEPVVTTGVKEGGAAFAAATDMYLHVYHNGDAVNPIRYRFDNYIVDTNNSPSLQDVIDVDQYAESPSSNNYVDASINVDTSAYFEIYINETIYGSFYQEAGEASLSAGDNASTSGVISVKSTRGYSPALIFSSAVGSTTVLLGSPVASNVSIDIPTPSTASASEQFYTGLSVNGVKFDSDGDVTVVDTQGLQEVLDVGHTAQSPDTLSTIAIDMSDGSAGDVTIHFDRDAGAITTDVSILAGAVNLSSTTAASGTGTFELKPVPTIEWEVAPTKITTVEFIDPTLLATLQFPAPNAADTYPLGITLDGVKADTNGDFKSPIKYVKISLSAGQLSTLNTAPVNLVGAQGAGTFIDVISSVVSVNFNSIVYDFPGNAEIKYTSSASTALFKIDSATLNSTSSIKRKNRGTVATGDIEVFENEAVRISGLTSNPTTGDGTMDVYLEYIVRTL